MNNLTPLNNFISNYLNGSSRHLEKIFVLGNISCDLDSFLSSYLLSIANNFRKEETIYSNNKLSKKRIKI